MIGRLRKRFIRIAMLSVALVMLLLSVVVNSANYFSVNNDIDMLLFALAEDSFRDGQPQLPDEADSGRGQHKGQGFGQGQGSGGQGPGGGMQGLIGRQGERFSRETPFSTRYFILNYDAEGKLLSSDMTHIAAVTEQDADEYLAVACKHGEGSAYYNGYKYRVRALPDGTLQAIFLDCHSELHGVRTVLIMTLIADASCLVLVYILVVVFSKKAIDPVVRSAQQQKQFITDASHELKTPLTVMTTSLKVLEMEVGQSKWIDKAAAQTEKMTELVNDLVTLSRMDEEEPPITLVDFDIRAAVEETAESFRDSALAAGHALRCELPERLTYHGDESAIRRLVSILLDNAVKYAAEDGEITLTLKKEHGAVVLRQSNPCEPIEEGELAKLFDRFYRADKSRSSEKKGFGVGLSIARGIVEAHRGSISAACPREGMIEFTATLK